MKIFLSITLNILIYVAIVAVIVKGVPYILQKKLGSEQPMATITSGSMWPVLRTWDVVFIEKVAREEIKKGDIIVWRHEGGYTIHRVVSLGVKTLTTKGDANFAEDAPVSYESVVGRAVARKNGAPLRIPYIGMVTNLGVALRSALASPSPATTNEWSN